MPHKEVAFGLVDEIFGVAKNIGAINTIVRQGEKLIGYNTDAGGFLKSISEFKDVKKVLILGAGGTAKAISSILKDTCSVTILNRSASRLEEFEANGYECYTHDSFTCSEFDLIINTTSAGLKDDSLPVSKDLLESLFSNSKYAYDVIYNKNTPFLNLAKQNGTTCKDGKDMLLWQGVVAFNLFNNNSLNEEEIKFYMQEALEL